MAWRVIEKDPEIKACDAMMAAAVAMPTRGTSAHCGASRKNGWLAVGVEHQERSLPEIVEDEGG